MFVGLCHDMSESWILFKSHALVSNQLVVSWSKATAPSKLTTLGQEWLLRRLCQSGGQGPQTITLEMLELSRAVFPLPLLAPLNFESVQNQLSTWRLREKVDSTSRTEPFSLVEGCRRLSKALLRPQFLVVNIALDGHLQDTTVLRSSIFWTESLRIIIYYSNIQ